MFAVCVCVAHVRAFKFSTVWLNYSVLQFTFILIIRFVHNWYAAQNHLLHLHSFYSWKHVSKLDAWCIYILKHSNILHEAWRNQSITLGFKPNIEIVWARVPADTTWFRKGPGKTIFRFFPGYVLRKSSKSCVLQPEWQIETRQFFRIPHILN